MKKIINRDRIDIKDIIIRVTLDEPQKNNIEQKKSQLLCY